MSPPPFFATKKYLLLALIISAIALYAYFMVLFTIKMNSTEVKTNADEQLKGDFKPISNAMPLSVSLSGLGCKNR